MSVLASMYERVYRAKAPYYLEYSLLEICWRPCRKFLSVVIIPCVPMNWIRISMYRMIGYKIGKNVFIGMRCYLDDLEPDHIEIADGVTCSYGVFFALHGRGQTRTHIKIGENAYIGTRALLIAGKTGVSLGARCVVGAGSVVTRDVPSGAVVVGVPARVVDSELSSASAIDAGAPDR